MYMNEIRIRILDSDPDSETKDLAKTESSSKHSSTVESNLDLNSKQTPTSETSISSDPKHENQKQTNTASNSEDLNINQSDIESASKNIVNTANTESNSEDMTPEDTKDKDHSKERSTKSEKDKIFGSTFQDFDWLGPIGHPDQ